MTDKTQPTAAPGKYWARLCALPKFSFLLSAAGGVARAQDSSGNWVEASAVQQIVDDAESRIAELEALQAAPPAPAALAVPAEVELPAREPWLLYLSDRADGVKGHYAIARWNPRGFREVWNLRRHAWSSFSDDVLTLQQAETLLQNLAIPTAPVQVTAQPTREPLTAEQIEVSQDHFARAQEHATQLAGQGQECGVCGSDEAFTGTCGGGRTNSRALCFQGAAPAQAQEDARDAELFRAMANAAITEDAAFGECLERLGGDCKTIDDIRAVFDAARAAQGGPAC